MAGPSIHVRFRRGDHQLLKEKRNKKQQGFSSVKWREIARERERGIDRASPSPPSPVSFDNWLRKKPKMKIPAFNLIPRAVPGCYTPPTVPAAAAGSK